LAPTWRAARPARVAVRPDPLERLGVRLVVVHDYGGCYAAPRRTLGEEWGKSQRTRVPSDHEKTWHERGFP
jgi:hypothetical protein